MGAKMFIRGIRKTFFIQADLRPSERFAWDVVAMAGKENATVRTLTPAPPFLHPGPPGPPVQGAAQKLGDAGDCGGAVRGLLTLRLRQQAPPISESACGCLAGWRVVVCNPLVE